MREGFEEEGYQELSLWEGVGKQFSLKGLLKGSDKIMHLKEDFFSTIKPPHINVRFPPCYCSKGPVMLNYSFEKFIAYFVPSNTLRCQRNKT